MPPCLPGYRKATWRERLLDPELRARVLAEMTEPTTSGWHQERKELCWSAELRRYTGMTLSEVAAERGTSDADTIIDLVIEDGGRVQVVYFMMSEENVARGIALPWVSFASDAQSMAGGGLSRTQASARLRQFRPGAWQVRS